MKKKEKINILYVLRGGTSAETITVIFRWYFTLMLNFPMIPFCTYCPVCLYINASTVYLWYLFTLNFRLPLSPLIPSNIKFVRLWFIQRAIFEELIPRSGRGLAVLYRGEMSVLRYVVVSQVQIRWNARQIPEPVWVRRREEKIFAHGETEPGRCSM
jgi:hypothetical protein